MQQLHQEYARSIWDFLSALPPALRFPPEQADNYFRSAIMSVWARGHNGSGDQEAISQIYTEKQIRFTEEQYRRAISYFKGDIRARVPDPAFFPALVRWDSDKGTNFTGSFLALQDAVLTLAAAYDGSLTLGESRQITALKKQLEHSAGRAPASDARKPDQRQALNQLLDELQSRLSQDVARDFFGPEAAPPSAAPAEPSAAPAGEKQAAGETEPAQEEPVPTLEEAMAELNALVGLESVKADVESLVNLVKVRNLRRSRGMKCPTLSLHLVFSGNPGTGKTTVARIIGKIYRALGVLSKGQLVEVDRSGLVAGYVGQTAIKTQEVIQRALGGILFIDEAYALAPEHAGQDFGQEAINTILKAMEDHRDDLVVIVAGYASLMPRFIQSNPGLPSRFNKYLTFEDYTPQQLLEIFRLRAEGNDYRLSPQAEDLLRRRLEVLYENRDENFGNARTVRNFFEKAVARQADRVAQLEAPTDEDIRTILPEDLQDML